MTDESKASPQPNSSWRRYLAHAWDQLRKGWSYFTQSGSSEAYTKPTTRYLHFFLFVVAFCILLYLAYRIVDALLVYYLARSYVDEIAEAADLNPYLAKALLYSTFVLLAIFTGMVVRFSKRKRLFGLAGIFSLLLAHALVMSWLTWSTLINRKGEALECYVITRDGVIYHRHPGIDPETGRQCRPVKPEIIGKLKEYEKGKRPTRIVGVEPVFFDPGTGEAIVWYHRDRNDQIELYNLMGFDPNTGEELLPVTKEVAQEWKKQNDRKPPQEIDPRSYAFFDPVTGKPRVWYWRGENGDYKFYDKSGFYPLTGEPLILVTRDVINEWQNYLKDLKSKNAT